MRKGVFRVCVAALFSLTLFSCVSANNEVTLKGFASIKNLRCKLMKMTEK